MNVEYVSPIGELIADPELPVLKDLVLNEGELYWNAGSGGAALDCAWNGDTASLELIFEKSSGFYLVYRDIEQNQFISLGSGDFDHTVAPVYGASHYYSRRSFLFHARVHGLRSKNSVLRARRPRRSHGRIASMWTGTLA